MTGKPLREKTMSVREAGPVTFESSFERGPSVVYLTATDR
jgi:hypothetical protein